MSFTMRMGHQVLLYSYIAVATIAAAMAALAHMVRARVFSAEDADIRRRFATNAARKCRSFHG